MPRGRPANTKVPVYHHWSEDPRKVRLMKWCLTPPTERVPKTRIELADLLQVSNRTLGNWMEQVEFRADWQREAHAVIGPSERTKLVLDTLYRAATDPTNRNHVQAAKLYLEATKAIQPRAKAVTVVDPAKLSDRELDELLARGAALLQAERDEGEAIERANTHLADEPDDDDDLEPVEDDADDRSRSAAASDDRWRDDESGCPWPPSISA